MDEIKKRLKILKWDNVITAILLIITGLVFIVCPQGSAALICGIIGYLLIFAGIAVIIGSAAFPLLFVGEPLLTGAVLLLAGIFFVMHPDLIFGILTVIAGGFIAVKGIRSLADGIECARTKEKGWLGLLLVGAVITLLGLHIVFNVNAAMTYVGMILLICGLADLFSTFIFSRRIRHARKTMHRYMDEKDPIDVEWREM